jgi:hypothetical protein
MQQRSGFAYYYSSYKVVPAAGCIRTTATCSGASQLAPTAAANSLRKSSLASVRVQKWHDKKFQPIDSCLRTERIELRSDGINIGGARPIFQAMGH